LINLINRLDRDRMSKIKFKDLEPVSATNAKVHFGELLHQTSIDGRIFVVNRQGRPVSVILSYKQYCELLEKQKP
jgi:prevent-host-death family protein